MSSSNVARTLELFDEEPYRSPAIRRLGRSARPRRAVVPRILRDRRHGTVQAAAADAAAFRARVHLTSVDPARNRYRFYSLSWQPLLFGGGALIRSWGRIGTAGRTLAMAHPDRASAQPAIEQLLLRRLRRGYQVVEVC